jgi:transcription-repair coupling factor (superfamily II helicase)
LIEQIRELPAYRSFLQSLQSTPNRSGLGLMRSARLPVIAALHQDIEAPFLVITDRTDRALAVMDELSYWMGGQTPYYYPEPNPLFYEPAAWGTVTRRDRLQALTALSTYHMLGAEPPAAAPIIVAPARAVMKRTLPRRDFL